MAVPVLLVTGFLGAGKTTLLNRLLTEPHGRRLAAVVNDFGTIDIDAALLAGAAGAADGVVSLRNGCICCSLQGDLLRTLAAILRRLPPPDGIVIETSGVSDPAEIVRALLDPVIWRAASLDAVVCVVDAQHLTDRPDLQDDALWQAQLAAADFVALSKPDLVSEAELARVRAVISRWKPAPLVHTMQDGRIAPELLFAAHPHSPGVAPPRQAFATAGFESLAWSSAGLLYLERFQIVIGQLAGRVLRAKGFVRFAAQPEITMLFQLVGQRATLAPADRGIAGPLQVVFIARDGVLAEERLGERLDGCLAAHAGGAAV